MKHELVITKSGSGFCGHEYCPGNCYSTTYSCTCGVSIKAYGTAAAEKAVLEHRIDLLEARA